MIKNKKETKTKLMGILNITPDSFSDGGLYYKNIEAAMKKVGEIISEGSDFLDIGGESTRPGSEKVDSGEEMARLLPVIEAIRSKFKKAVLSVDTYKSETAEQVLKKGVSIINSLGGFEFDKKLAQIAATYQCKVIIYHIKGEPKYMQSGQIVYDDLIGEISEFFQKQIDTGIKNGMNHEQFILDPGIGFGKTLDHNITIIKRLSEFKKFNLPIAIGLSRKSHLGQLMAKNLKLKEIPGTDERLEAGLAETACAVMNGANIVRTHDIKETKRFLSVLEEFI